MNRRHENLFTQLKTYRSDLLAVAEEFTDEEAEFIPRGFNNNVRWNLGHVYLDQYLWIQAVTKEEMPYPKSFLKWFHFQTSPQDFTEQTPSTDELKLLLKEQTDYIMDTFGHRLDEEFPPTEMGIFTIEQALIRTIFHEGMHLQTIIDIKKLIK